MAVKSPEAIERKRVVDNARKKAKRAAKRKELQASLALKQNLLLSSHKITARRMRGPIGNLSKLELREMLAQAFQNTARMG